MFVTEIKEYIYKNNKIPFVLEKLGCKKITYHNTKNYYSACFKDGDNPMGINIRNNEYLNYCSWSRNVPWDKGQDLISLIEYSEQCDFVTALKWLHNILDISYSNEDIKNKKKKKPNLKAKALSVFTNHLSHNQAVNINDIEILDKSVLDEYVPIEYIGFLREGITPYACKKFNIEYSYRRKRIIIPQKLWSTGEIIGLNARTAIDGYEQFGINKYSFTKGYNKSINIYGLWENYKSIQRKGYCCVFESEKSVLKRYSQFDETAVALSGKFISEEQKRILIGLNVDIILCLDNDVSIEEIYTLCEKFYGIRNVYFVKDFKGILGKKDSPADVCDDLYEELLRNKIKYTEELHEKYLKEINKEK